MLYPAVHIPPFPYFDYIYDHSLPFQIYDNAIFPHPQFEVWGALQLLQVGQGVATDSFDGCNDPQNYLAR